MAPSAGLMAPIAMRFLRTAIQKTSTLIKARIEKLSLPGAAELQPILVRSVPRQPINRIALLRQNKGRWYTTHSSINASLRRFMSSGPAKHSRTALPKSSTGTAVYRLASRAPFASQLRPNLTGGALPRTSGGYTLGGGRGARYFSHTPAAPAEVVNNVSAAIRAFCLSGQKAQYNGMTPAGDKRYRSVTPLQKEAGRKMKMVARSAPGSFIDFPVSPVVTALSPLGATFPFSSPMEQSALNLNTDGFLEVLSVDFTQALKTLAITMNDLKRLASFGDLPITLEPNSVLRVHFPGCDAETVENLCNEAGVQRGIIHQDADFDASVGAEIALIFPYAPTSEYTLSSPGGSLRSQTSHDYEEVDANPWLEGYETESGSGSEYFSKPSEMVSSSSADYEGVAGIYRFIEQCDNARRV